jgi:nitrite reductase (NO-forming)
MEAAMKSISPARIYFMIALLLIMAVVTSACGTSRVVKELNPDVQPAGQQVALAATGNQTTLEANLEYTLRTELGSAGMVFVGVGGDIDGLTNPPLRAAKGDVVQITLVNGDGMQHDIALPELDVASEFISEKGTSTLLVFEVNDDGEYVYYCTVPGHRQAGMEGRLIVGESLEATVSAASVALDPTDLPGPLGIRPPQTGYRNY